jgi:hypothetical protein
LPPQVSKVGSSSSNSTPPTIFPIDDMSHMVVSNSTSKDLSMEPPMKKIKRKYDATYKF